MNTPRTDKNRNLAAKMLEDVTTNTGFIQSVKDSMRLLIENSNDLERSLAASRAREAQLRESIQIFNKSFSCFGQEVQRITGKNYSTPDEAARIVLSEAKALREALEGMMPERTGYGQSMCWDDYNIALNIARAALAQTEVQNG
jgi:hypothetical protein